MTAERLLVHVGYPKTATTTLQNTVFSKLPGLRYLGKPFSRALQRVEESIIVDDDAAFARKLPDYRGLFAEALSDRPCAAALSHEGLLRYNRHHARGGNPLARTCSRVADVLTGMADRTRILLTIRRQEDLVISFCQHFPVLEETGLGFHEYLATALEAPDEGLLGSLRYDRIAGLYADRFGRENVIVLPYEELVQDAARFSVVVAEAIGADAADFQRLLRSRREKQGVRDGLKRIRVDPTETAIIRLTRRLVPRQLRVKSLPGGSAIKSLLRQRRLRTATEIAYQEHEIARIRELFSKPNRALAETYDIDLMGYGYAL